MIANGWIFTDLAPRPIQSSSRNVSVCVCLSHCAWLLIVPKRFEVQYFVTKYNKFVNSKSWRISKWHDWIKSYSNFNDKKCFFFSKIFWWSYLSHLHMLKVKLINYNCYQNLQFWFKNGFKSPILGSLQIIVDLS